ncbi:hypothetical protein TNCV_2867141 [Trichonephila clavipes]|nr:hypothetical protein TNCV_2867141 [Trichonephila clavipes]
MQCHKCYSCELWDKETEKMNGNSNTPMGQKTFYEKAVQHQVPKITARSRSVGLKVVLHGILYVLEYFSRQSCGTWR